MSKAVLVDLTKCIGCKSCQTTCKQWNDLPATKPEFNNDLTYPADTDGYTYTTVLHRILEKDGQETMRFAKTQCLHCLDPACASVCMSKAFQTTAEGAVVYNPTLCVGCRYCMIACPFDIPKYQWDKALFPLVSKCQMCHTKIAAGQEPACVDACPTGTLKYGDRDELIAYAKETINKDPKYVKHIYGEKEAGGTSWLYISDVEFKELGFVSNVPERALPHYTHDYLKWTPAVFLGGGALFTAMRLYTKRRNDITKENNKNSEE